MPEEITTPQIPEPEKIPEPENPEKKDAQVEKFDSLPKNDLKELTPNPITDFFKKIRNKITPFIRQIKEKWKTIDEKKRKKIIQISGAILLVLLSIFVWKIFLNTKKTSLIDLNQTKTTTTAEPDTKNTLRYKKQTPSNTNSENRVIPALNSSDLESWTGLKQDRYEMQKRGQIKTVPEKIIESIPSLPD